MSFFDAAERGALTLTLSQSNPLQATYTSSNGEPLYHVSTRKVKARHVYTVAAKVISIQRVCRPLVVSKTSGGKVRRVQTSPLARSTSSAEEEELIARVFRSLTGELLKWELSTPIPKVLFSIYHSVLVRRISGPSPITNADHIELQKAFRRILQSGLGFIYEDSEDGGNEGADRSSSPAAAIVRLERYEERAVDFRNWMRTWFGKAPWSHICVDQVHRWLYWSTFNAAIPPQDKLPEEHRSSPYYRPHKRLVETARVVPICEGPECLCLELGWAGPSTKSTRGVTLISHSNGSYSHAWMLKSCPEYFTRSCFVDPVTFCSWEGDVCFNFVYRTCTTGVDLIIRYFVGTELGVVNLIQRNFDWLSNTLWIEEVPNPRDPRCTLFLLGGRDCIVDSDRVKKYLTSHGVKNGLWYNPEGRHGQSLLVGSQGVKSVIKWINSPNMKN
ncbi:hypothetical protein EW145_g1537 [Phellinidium pouzarii]|uniref:Uncharacterized protein n=1 Tax=Phellinidium pouzarii TaxID=167371 RepID=A0A4S4LE17_9AGAM|nr:hypothetical protein EW145_g1537 [Phellinidium pouzarii]